MFICGFDSVTFGRWRSKPFFISRVVLHLPGPFLKRENPTIFSAIYLSGHHRLFWWSSCPVSMTQISPLHVHCGHHTQYFFGLLKQGYDWCVPTSFEQQIVSGLQVSSFLPPSTTKCLAGTLTRPCFEGHPQRPYSLFSLLRLRSTQL